MVSARPGERLVTTTTLHVPYPGGPAVAKAEIRRSSLNRSFSEPNLLDAGTVVNCISLFWVHTVDIT